MPTMLAPFLLGVVELAPDEELEQSVLKVLDCITDVHRAAAAVSCTEYRPLLLLIRLAELFMTIFQRSKCYFIGGHHRHGHSGKLND